MEKEKSIKKESKLEKILKLYNAGQIKFTYPKADYNDTEIVFDTWLKLNKKEKKDEKITKYIKLLEDVIEEYAEVFRDNDLTEAKHRNIDPWKLKDDDPRWVYTLDYGEESIPEIIMEFVNAIKKQYNIIIKKSSGYGVQFLSKNTHCISEKNKAKDLINRIDKLYEKSFNHMYASEPIFRDGYYDDRSYIEDTITIMKDIVEYADKVLNSNSLKNDKENKLVDLREILVYYNNIASYRGHANGKYVRNYDDVNFNNPNLFKLNFKKYAQSLLGESVCGGSVPYEYTVSRTVYDKEGEEDYLPLNLRTSHIEKTIESLPCKFICKAGFAANSIQTLGLLASKGKLIITELPEDLENDLCFYNAGLLSPTEHTLDDEVIATGEIIDGKDDPEEDTLEWKNNGRERFKKYVDTMSEIHPDFINKTFKAIKESAEEIIKERINSYNNEFKQINNSNQDIRKNQEEQLTK